MTQQDFTKLPQGTFARQQLALFLRDSGDAYERHYLEVKSDVDLTSKHGRAKVVKFILGTSNRMPDVAAKFFDGHALMAIGIDHGAIPGVPQFEEHELRRFVDKYTRNTMTWWTELVTNPDGGDNVVFVVVSPPSWGDPIRVCYESLRVQSKKDTTRQETLLHEGAIYVRPSSETRSATGDEIDALSRRISVGSTSTQAHVDVALRGYPVRISHDPQILDEYIEATRTWLSEEPRDPETDEGLNFIERLRAQTWETRSAEEFNQQLDDWEAAVREAWPSLIDLIAQTFTWSEIEVSHLAGSYLNGIDVAVSLSAGVVALTKKRRNDFDIQEALPKPPPAWCSMGPPGAMSLGATIADLQMAQFYPNGLATPTHRVISFDNRADGVVLDGWMGDLRQEQVINSGREEFVLVIRDSELTQVTGDWRVRGKDHDHVYTGSISVEIHDVDISDDLRRYLGLQDDDEALEDEDADRTT